MSSAPTRVKRTTLSAIRTVLFYCAFALWTALWSLFIVLCAYPFSVRNRHRIFIRTWAVVAINLCRLICGIRWQVKGREHIPDTACVVISNHQSTWETFFLQTLLSPQTQVVKQELLQIPFFGWALKAINPIAINRKNARRALGQVREQGKVALAKGIWVLIFPEGTRTPSGTLGKFSRGGAGLAKAASVDVLPVAHNAGTCWPNRSWLKHPGIIQVEICPVINTEHLSVAEVNDAAQHSIDQAMKKMP